MNDRSSNIQFSGKPGNALIWITSAALVLFCIPLIAMHFTGEVAWDETDFIAWGMLLFVAGSACLWASRKLPRRKWLVAGAIIAVVFIYVWAELAVGIFTNLGS